MKKIVYIFTLLLGLSFTGHAQSEKIKEKATEKVEQLNNEIIASDESLALSDMQKSEIHQIHVERIMAARKAEKSGVSDEDKKAIQKRYFKKIYNDVLTKEQIKARKAGKGKSKK
jgi:hypothetical protein